LIQAASPSGADEPVARFGIGEVLVRLRGEFADVTISKIRFLETEGLVTPARAPSGYRKFCEADVERLRYVLAAQRDQYLPLKVIKEHLAAIDRGLAPPAAGGRPMPPETPDATVPEPADFAATTRELRLTRDELLESAGITADQLDQLETHGLVRRRGRHYDADALTIARTAGQIAAYGVEARHLRTFRTAADREAGLVEQVTAPLERQRGAEARDHADQVAAQLTSLIVKLHTALLRASLKDIQR
jgi:DNA-binding transcriptional MerR regulator